MIFFFFKQKTAYEMRISDWSSDVCSSDLRTPWIENLRGPLSGKFANVCVDLTRRPMTECGKARKIDQSHRNQCPLDPQPARSEQRRVGKACVRTGRSRWSPYH